MGPNWQNRVEISDVSGRVRCERGWQLDRAWSQRLTDYDLWLIWAGRGILTVEDQTLSLRPGVCLWMRPGRTYLASQDLHNRLGVSYVHFRITSLPSFVPPFEVTEAKSLPFVESTLTEIMRYRGSEPRLANRLLGGLLRCLELDHTRPAGGSRVRNRRSEQIWELLDRIREEPGKNWRVAELAAEVGLAADHFSRVFREIAGERPQAFVLRLRLQRAQQLLLETSLQVGEVAQAVGFRDIFYFSRQFSKHFGLPPSVYRRTGGVNSRGGT